MPERDPEHFDFASFFSAKLKERGLTLRKLSELSGISMEDLKNMSEGDFAELPPAPYLRGYTARLAKILEFDPEIWWLHFERLGVLKHSGSDDRLPENRFALSRAARSRWVIAFAVVLVLYGAIRFSRILGEPVVTVLEPSAATAQVTASNITIRGIVEYADTVSVNGESVPVAADGSWQKTVSLEPGLNTIAIKSKKFLGRETSVIRQIVYEPTSAIPTPASFSSSTPSGNPVTSSSPASSSF